MKLPSPADIAAMIARGDDPIAIAKAEQRLQRWHEAQEIGPLIEAAFAGVTLGDGVGLHEARAIDDYADAATRAARRTADEKEDWRRLSPEELNHCDTSLTFVDAEGMRFFLPAYLLAELRGEFEFGHQIFNSLTQGWPDRFSLFSEAQREAVRAFLRYAIGHPDYEDEWPLIVDAWDWYWAPKSASPK